MSVLSEKDIRAGIASLDGWSLTDGAITKQYLLDDFLGSILFVNRITGAAEAASHHPDLSVSWNKVTVTLVMPAMPAMNMPEMRSSFEVPWMAGKNMYMGRGTVPLAGSWTVTVEVSKDGKLIGTHRARVSATT